MPSQPNIMIVGPSGSGKSTSLESLFKAHAKEIAFFDLERKGLPFLFNTSTLGYYSECVDYDTTLTAMQEGLKKPGIKIAVYDSLSKWLEYDMTKMRGKYTGYDIFSNYNNEIGKFFDLNKNSGKIWITTCIDELVYVEQPGGARVSRLRAACQGKIWEGKMEKEFLVVLYSQALATDGKVAYHFYPHTDGIHSAKSPIWLGLPEKMKNDVNVVVDKLLIAQQQQASTIQPVEVLKV